MTKKEILYVYTRSATYIQGVENESLKAQKEIGIAKAKELGMDYVVFQESEIRSGLDNLKVMPTLYILAELIRLGVVKNIFVYDISRISRQFLTYFEFLKLIEKHEVILHTQAGVIDSKVPSVLNSIVN